MPVTDSAAEKRLEPLVLVDTAGLTEEEWLSYRRRGIGGSDVAALLGISPWRTARDLYYDKLNVAAVEDEEGNWVALEMGHLLEPLVAKIFERKVVNQPDNKINAGNNGRGAILWWGLARTWTFENDVCSSYQSGGNTRERLIMAFRVIEKEDT